MWPWGVTVYTMHTTAAPAGRLASDIAKALVLTAVANTPAAAGGPATLTGAKAIIAPGFNTKQLFESRLRKIPVKMQFLPYVAADATSIIWALQT